MSEAYTGTLTVDARMPGGEWGVRNVIKPDGKRTYEQAHKLASTVAGRWWELNRSTETRVSEHPHGYDSGYKPSAGLQATARAAVNLKPQPASAGFRF